VSGLIASGDSAWSYGGSILTFAFPMILFIVVAVALYVLYTKPEIVPGHRTPAAEHPVSYTAIPGTPTVAEVGGSTAFAAGDPAAGPAAPSAPSAPAAPGSPAADAGTKAGEGENAEPQGPA
jgi:hypothetical protein